MKPAKLFAAVLVMLLSIMLAAGCAGDRDGANGAENGAAAETGTLVFTANGEEFVREGFLTKDGWDITFEHAYVTLGGITAYQTDPPYDVDQGWDINYMVKVELPGTYTVDLADPEADPAVVAEETAAPAGRYNALSWNLVRAAEGPAEGSVLLLAGRAARGEEEIEFVLRLDEEVAYLGGEYIGDQRKGLLTAGGSAELEMTFHFDHLFGDGTEDENDPLNLDALGFDPLAALAVDGKVEVNTAALRESLDSENFELLQAIMIHLAHVGEGHCLARFLE